MSARRGTYSIVARDPRSGELGVAVQSHWFSVGSVVSWARPGVGAVATQSILEPSYGPLLLDRLDAGEQPASALEAAVAGDPGAPVRQVAVVSAAGTVAAHTGDECIPFAGDATGDGFSAQANMMASANVWPAMAEAFGATRGPLVRRLLAGLEAGEAAGGDVRGRQSAAVLVVPAEGERWRTRVDLRVEDHPEPLAELRRLIVLGEAYELADEGDALAGEGRHAEAAECYRRASELAPENTELRFWAGLSLAQGGDVEGGAAVVREVVRAEPGWGALLARLAPEIAPAAASVRDALGIEPDTGVS